MLKQTQNDSGGTLKTESFGRLSGRGFSSPFSGSPGAGWGASLGPDRRCRPSPCSPGQTGANSERDNDRLSSNPTTCRTVLGSRGSVRSGDKRDRLQRTALLLNMRDSVLSTAATKRFHSSEALRCNCKSNPRVPVPRPRVPRVVAHAREFQPPPPFVMVS